MNEKNELCNKEWKKYAKQLKGQVKFSLEDVEKAFFAGFQVPVGWTRPACTKIPEALDKRIRLMSSDKQKVRELYKTGDYTKAELARMFEVSVTCIYRTLDENYRKAQSKYVVDWIRRNRSKQEFGENFRKSCERKMELRRQGLI